MKYCKDCRHYRGDGICNRYTVECMVEGNVIMPVSAYQERASLLGCSSEARYFSPTYKYWCTTNEPDVNIYFKELYQK